jgi:hypothetical protein
LRRGSLLVRTQVTRPSGQVSFSSLLSIGSPVRMIRCSSSKARVAWSELKKSKSVFPWSCSREAQPSTRSCDVLAVMKRESRSLK